MVVMRWCFQCARDYDDVIDDCPECAVELVDTEPIGADELGAGGVDLVAYELHEWAPGVRHLIDVTLTQRDVVHRWDGASLQVREEHEDLVDVMLDAFERVHLPTLEPDAERVTYQFTEWSAEQREHLSQRLGLDGVTHEFDLEDQLVVHEEDEDLVDEIVDRIREEFVAERRSDGTVKLEGVELADLLADVFIAGQRLAKNPNDHNAVISTADSVGRLLEVRRPFGFDAVTWFQIRDDAEVVREALEKETDDSTLVDLASNLRDRLRPVV